MKKEILIIIGVILVVFLTGLFIGNLFKDEQQGLYITEGNVTMPDGSVVNLDYLNENSTSTTRVYYDTKLEKLIFTHSTTLEMNKVNEGGE